MALALEKSSPGAETTPQPPLPRAPSKHLPQFAWMPIAILLILTGVLYLANVRRVYLFPYGLMGLNFLFLTLSSFFIAYLLARAFLTRGNLILLLLGTGIVIWGASAATVMAGRSDLNAMVTVLNSGALLAAVCHLAAGLRYSQPQRLVGAPGFWLPVAYGAALSAVALLSAVAWEGLLPRFLTPAGRGTRVSNIVLGTAIGMFVVAAALLRTRSLRTSSRFLHWYSMALLLLAVGLLGVSQSTPETLLSWVGRASQYWGGVYMLVAAVVSVRESGILMVPLETALQESEGRFQALAAATFEGIAIIEDGKFTDANDQLLEMLGYSREEFIGMEVAATLVPEEKERVLENIRLGRESNLDLVIRCKGARHITAEVHGRTVQYLGRQVRMTVVRDVTERKLIEEKLRNSERLYRAIGESIDYGVWVCDPDGRNIYASESFLKLVGLTQQQCSDFGWGTVLHPEDAGRTIAAWKECVRAGSNWDIEHRFRGIDGQWHDVLARGVPVRDAQGKVACWAGINLDISSLKQAQTKLEEAKRTLDALMEFVPEGITIADAPDGKIRMVSRYGKELLGGEHEGVVASDVALRWKVFHHDGLTPMEDDELPLVRALQKGETVRDAEIVQVNARGQALWLTCNAAPIRDSKGGIVGSIVAWHDITVRRKIELALRQSEERYRSLFNGMTEGFAIHEIICDTQGIPCDYRFLDINAAFERLTGLKRSEVVGRTLREVLPQNASEWVAIYGKVALTGESVRFERYAVALQKHYEIFAYQPAPAQFAVIFMDITERKRAEEELQKAQAKLKEHAQDLEKTVARRTARLHETIAELEHFSYAIVHDMRAPLRAMQGFAEMIQEEGTAGGPDLSREYLRRIRVAAGRMDQLITDSLSYSKAARQELPLEPVDLIQLLKGLVDTYPNLQPDRANIQISDTIPRVMGNEAALTQCFSNLLGNAVKFAKPGSKPEIRVWAEASEKSAHDRTTSTGTTKGGQWVKIWVEDDGIGIPKDSLSRIFGIFQRATTSQEGTGIGLAIVRKVAQRMGGEVGVESREGVGSRFWVALARAP